MSKKIIFTISFVLACSFLFARDISKGPTDQLSIPQIINYQGKLTNASGIPVSDSTYSITFRFFASSSGGTALWTENQSVQTHVGLFNCLLGSVTSITSIPADGNLYLEMQVNPNSAMTPRIRIVSSAYAFLAKKADTAYYATSAPLTRPITPPIATTEITDGAITNIKLGADAITTDKILNGTILRADVVTNFKAPYSDTADYVRNINVPYVDSARVAVNAYNANKLQGKDTTALDTRFVNEGQTNSVSSAMITDNTIIRNDVATNFKAPYADTSDYARTTPAVDSVRIAANAYNAYKLQGKDTIALSAKFVDEGQVSSITSAMITDNTITRNDVATNFKAPYADSADYVKNVSVPYVDSARVAVNAYNANKLQGKDTTALDTRFVNEGQTNSITSGMITDNTIVRNDVATNFKSPYADSADYVKNISVPYVDSARIAVNAYDAYKLQGKDTIALSAKFVDEGQVNSITSSMITDNTIVRSDVATNFTAPYSDTAEYARSTPPVGVIDSARVAINAYNAYKLQGKDTIALSTKFVDEGQANSITSSMITDNTIVRNDVATNFKSPDADSADYVRNINVPYVDSARVAVNAYNAKQLQGKDTTALSAKFVDEGQVNSISNTMINDNAVTSAKISDGTITRTDVATNFKAPYSDTSDYVRNINVPYVDSARVAVNAYNAKQLQGKDTTALSAKFIDENQTAGGDLTGTYPNPTITNNAVNTAKIADTNVTMAKIQRAGATSGQVIKWNGSAWIPSNDSAGGPLVGSAGGDLTGTYPNPTIANDVVSSSKILNGTITGDDIAKPLSLTGSTSFPNAIIKVRNNSSGPGISIDSAGFGGLYVNYSFTDGVIVKSALQTGVWIDSAGGQGIRIASAAADGIGIDDVGFNGLYAMHVGDNGVSIDSAETNGVLVHGNIAGGDFYAGNAGAVGLFAHSYNNSSSDTAIQAYGKGFATGGWFTGGLLDDKSAPCLISPELGIVTAGSGLLSNGKAEINFEPLFAENIRTDIPIRITVTPKGKPAGLVYVTESKSTGFRVETELIPGLEKNTTDITFDWIAFGTLKDYQTTPAAQAQWQQMIQERMRQADARKAQRQERNKLFEQTKELR